MSQISQSLAAELLSKFKAIDPTNPNWIARKKHLENTFGSKKTPANNQVLAALALAIYLENRFPLVTQSVGDLPWAERYPKTRIKIITYLEYVEAEWAQHHDDLVFFDSAISLLQRFWLYRGALVDVFAEMRTDS